jgi:hypothetical protein
MSETKFEAQMELSRQRSWQGRGIISEVAVRNFFVHIRHSGDTFANRGYGHKQFPAVQFFRN